MKLIALFLAATASTAAIDDTVQQLKSPDRVQRLEAARELASLEKIPKSAVRPILDFARTELSNAVVPKRAALRGQPIKAIPLKGDETSLVRVKANPNQYLDKPFVICGAVEIDDYFNFGYRNSEGTHYSLSFVPLTKDAQVAGSEEPHVYVTRIIGAALVDQLATNEEGKDARTVVRMRVQIDSSHSRDPSDLVNGWDLFELIDWQFLSEDQQGWTPWAFDGLRICMALLKSLDTDAAPVLIEFICNDIREGSVTDTVARDLAARTLLQMNRPTRLAAAQKLRFQAAKIKTNETRDYALRVTAELNASGKRP